MTSTNIKNNATTASLSGSLVDRSLGQPRKLTPGGARLTVDEIRSRLNAASTHSTSSRVGGLTGDLTKGNELRFSADPPKSELKENVDGDSPDKNLTYDSLRTPSDYSLLELSESMLGYCQLLVESQRRTMNETAEFRETVKHLKAIFDEGNARERKHIDTLTHFPKVLKHLDMQYYLLKDKAKVLIRECQEDREKCQQECEAAANRIQDLETELFSAQTIYGQQAIEIENLQEATRNHRSLPNISQLLETLSKLEAQNSEIEKENKAVQKEVADLQDVYEKLLTDGNTDLADPRNKANGQPLSPSDRAALSQRDRMRLKDLRELVTKAKSQAESEKMQFEEILEKQRQENEQLKEEAHRLLDQLENRA